MLPALLLNYFGQGALLLREPEAAANSFYLMAPSWTLYGRYRIDLIAARHKYRIAGLHQTPTAGEGNRNILLLAAADSRLAQP